MGTVEMSSAAAAKQPITSVTGARRAGSSPGLGSTRASAVAAELRRLILSGELRPGTRLRQVELAERFQVSTTPVREAFTALTREGLVRHDAQRGVVVFAPTVRDVVENYEIRSALESLATEIAAKSIRDDELEHLDALVDRMRSAPRPSPAYQALNREFHRTVYAAAERPRLFEIIEALRDAFEAFIQFDVTARPDQRYAEKAHVEHEAIAKALRARAPKRARRLMETHLAHNAEHYRSAASAAAGAQD